MEALFLLVPLSVLTLAIAAWLFLRMNASGQFDEGDGPAYRVLMDDDKPSGEPLRKPAHARQSNEADVDLFDHSQREEP